MDAVQQGYHLNMAIVTDARAWDWTPQEPRFVTRHFASVYLGNTRGDEMAVRAKAAEFQARFTEGNAPGQFQFRLTAWWAEGREIELDNAESLL
jgi:hypothetical protein